MKKTFIAIAALTLVIAMGCHKGSTNEAYSPSSEKSAVTENAAQNLTPEQLGEIGAKIKKNPSDASKILAEHGLTEASFEKEIRKVSSDPEASRRYRDAYNKAV